MEGTSKCISSYRTFPYIFVVIQEAPTMSTEDQSIRKKLVDTGLAFAQNKAKYRFEELKIAGIEKGASIGGTTVVSILLLMAFLLTWFFGMLALCFYLAENLGYGSAWGFLYVCLGHLAFLVILLLFKGIISRIISYFIVTAIDK